MTLFHTTPDIDTAKAQTHALLIGVNDYPHLSGGTMEANARAPFTMGLGQLTSPVLSAMTLANWLKGNYCNPAAPLGSVELLLSTPNDKPPYGEASQNAIATAFDAWYRRCDRCADNIALFYFCGHGLEAEILVLLPSDFGQSPLRPWDNALDFHGTFDGMAGCGAKTQCFFIDACRNTPDEALRQRGAIKARPLVTTNKLVRGPRDAPVYLAAAFGESALAPPGGVSYFTEALLKCLDGRGARGRVGPHWVISTESLRAALRVLMIRTRDQNGRRLTCDMGWGVGNQPPTDLHECSGAGLVLTDITCQPADALEHARLTVTSPAGRLQRNPAAEPWELELDGDMKYDVAADFAGQGPYHSAAPLLGQLLYPPYQKLPLRAVP